MVNDKASLAGCATGSAIVAQVVNVASVNQGRGAEVDLEQGNHISGPDVTPSPPNSPDGAGYTR